LIIAFTLSPYGLVVYDTEAEEIIAKYQKTARIYGLDYDYKKQRFFLGFTNHIEILDKNLKKIWEHSNPQLADMHSLTRYNDKIYVACSVNERVIEINENGVYRIAIDLRNYLEPPKWFKEHEDWRKVPLVTHKQWCHLNCAYRINKHEYLLSLFQIKNNSYENISNGALLRVSDDEDVEMLLLESFGNGIVKTPHQILEHDKGYLIADSGNERIIKIFPGEDTIYNWETKTRTHWIEAISPIDLVITDCNRKDPKILMFNMISGRIEILWRPSKELWEFAKKYDDNNSLQPYVVKVLKK